MDHSETKTAPETRGRVHVRLLRKIGVAIAGSALIIAGIAMLVLPGPGIVAILAGLGLLGTEFPTARRLSTRLNTYAKTAWHALRNRFGTRRGTTT
ncbi:hypothetical protein E1293_24940 [Actinomadura darangshiensis]|uniref:TIGR02611 family protein n=1 Tax=Actinomadura darangshiensis TaxID=705336 RepID=A0A4V2YUL8_9ACTN|nr:PGPGW domain-containing protein [Actinomadura darangshiensis]TDD78027.1 hypothetical protein E1293_24940 [Actinomadura darangshiensis]